MCSGLVLREVMLGVAGAVSPMRTRPRERRFWLEKALPLCTHSSWPASLSTLLPPPPFHRREGDLAEGKGSSETFLRL